MPAPYSVAIVGAGAVTRASHLPALAARQDRVRVTAVCDVDGARAAALADEWGIEGRYTDVDTMLERTAPDLLVVCTPPGSHVPAIRAGLAAGAWVWCEKPPALSLADYDSAVELERDGGPYVSFVFQHRFGSAARHLRHLVRDGALGRPLVAVCHTLWFRDQAYYSVPWRGRWETEGGGPTMGHGIHQMDMLLDILGDWREVQARAGTLDRAVETEDVSMALVTLESGALASVVNSVLSPREVSYLRFDFQEATAEVSHLYGYDNADWILTPRPGARGEVAAAWPPTDDTASSHAAQLDVLLGHLDAGTRPPASGADGRRALELATGIYLAARSGAPVSRADLVPGTAIYDSLAPALDDRVSR
jgi:predicted dehydrogenase